MATHIEHFQKLMRTQENGYYLYTQNEDGTLTIQMPYAPKSPTEYQINRINKVWEMNWEARITQGMEILSQREVKLEKGTYYEVVVRICPLVPDAPTEAKDWSKEIVSIPTPEVRPDYTEELDPLQTSFLAKVTRAGEKGLKVSDFNRQTLKVGHSLHELGLLEMEYDLMMNLTTFTPKSAE